MAAEKMDVVDIVDRMLESSGDKPNYLHCLWRCSKLKVLAENSVKKIRNDMEKRYNLPSSDHLIEKHENYFLSLINASRKHKNDE